MSPFIPSAPHTATGTIAGDGWYPDLAVADFLSQSGLTVAFSADLIRESLGSAVTDCIAGVATWRAGQTAPSLATVPCKLIGNEPETVVHYRRAVFALARHRLLRLRPDHDTTADGHNRITALGDAADAWLAIHQQALRSLTGAGRIMVEAL